MKTKFKHILVILCLSMISCEGNLEPELFDQITPENFLTNEDDVKTAVTGVYAEFRGISEWGRYKTSWGSVMTLQEVPTDLWAANWFYKAIQISCGKQPTISSVKYSNFSCRP